MFIAQLNQKKTLLESQRDSLASSLAEQQAELNALISENPHLQSLRKGGKKKKDGKVKGTGRLQRKASPIAETSEVEKPVKTPSYKWKGEKLRRMGTYLVVVLMFLGVVYNRLMYMS